jgi:hypothetical protein
MAGCKRVELRQKNEEKAGDRQLHEERVARFVHACVSCFLAKMLRNIHSEYGSESAACSSYFYTVSDSNIGTLFVRSDRDPFVKESCDVA